MNRLVALPFLLAPFLAWASVGDDAERAAVGILIEENVLNVYVASNDTGRITLVFGQQIADWQVASVVQRLNAEPAIHGVSHSRADTDFCPIH